MYWMTVTVSLLSPYTSRKHEGRDQFSQRLADVCCNFIIFNIERKRHGFFGLDELIQQSFELLRRRVAGNINLRALILSLHILPRKERATLAVWNWTITDRTSFAFASSSASFRRFSA